MAAIRVVNGVTDSSQKGRYAFSVASLARRSGLPHVLVEIRHEASHNELPSLPLLRHGAEHALAWLSERYWSRQSRRGLRRILPPHTYFACKHARMHPHTRATAAHACSP